MSNFKVGDVVQNTDGVFCVVIGTDDVNILQIQLKSESGEEWSCPTNSIWKTSYAPDWTAQWREENMSQEDFEPLVDLIEVEAHPQTEALRNLSEIKQQQADTEAESDFKVGDAVTHTYVKGIYVVTAVPQEYPDHAYLSQADRNYHTPLPVSFVRPYKGEIPDWIIKWRKDNMPLKIESNIPPIGGTQATSGYAQVDTEESQSDALLEEELKCDIELGKKFSIGDVVQHSQGYAVISKKNPLLGMWWNEEGHRCSAGWSSLTLILTADGSSDR